MQEYNIGDIVEGIVSGIESYGIFVKINDNHTGLIHISEIDNNFIKDINEYVKINEKIYAEVIGFNEDKTRLNLSIKNINYDKNEKNGSKINESISGFLPLAKMLPKWIDKKLHKIKNE